MYGFTPSADDREARQAAAREQVEQAEQGVVLRRTARAAPRSTPGTGTWARNRKTIRIAEDEEDPAPDVRRPEGVQQRLEHGLRALVVVGGVGLVAVVAGRSLGVVGRRPRPSADSAARRSASAALGGSAASASASASSGARRSRPSASAVGGVGRRRRPSPAFGAFGGLAALAVAGRGGLGGPLGGLDVAAASGVDLPAGGGSAGGRPRLARRLARLARRRRAPAAISVGISRTETVPPAASILATARLRERVGDDEQRRRQLAVAEDLQRLVERPDEPDGAQDVLVDRERGGLADFALRRPRAVAAPRTRRARRARRSRRRSRPRSRS